MPKQKKSVSPKPGSAHARTRERRRERQQQRQERRRLTLAVIGAMAVVVIAVVYFLVNQPASAPIPAGTLDRYDGIPKSTTDEGFPVLGNPGAPVRVEEFCNFAYPACVDFHQTTIEELINLVRDGVISLTFVPVTLGGGINPAGAAHAALCAGEQGFFFEYHDALFAWQQSFGNKAFSQNRLSAGIKNLSLNQGRFNDCTGSSRIDNVIDTAEDSFLEREVPGAPGVFVNGFPVTAADVDSQADQMFQMIATQLEESGLAPVPLESSAEPAIEITPETTSEPEREITPEPETTEETPPSEVTPEATETTGGNS